MQPGRLRESGPPSGPYATGESDFSWTVDFAARRAKAREEMAPHLAEVERLKIEGVR